MCSNLNFSYNGGSTLWEPADATVISYVPALDENSFTAEVDNEDFYRGLYTDTGQVIRRTSLTVRMVSDDLKNLLEFRKLTRSDYFEATFNRIDPFMDGAVDTTQIVRFLKVSAPNRPKLKYYTTTIGFIK